MNRSAHCGHLALLCCIGDTLMTQQKCLSLAKEQGGAEGCQMGFGDEVKQQLRVVALVWSRGVWQRWHLKAGHNLPIH